MSVGTEAFCVDLGPPGCLREPQPHNATLLGSKVFTGFRKDELQEHVGVTHGTGKNISRLVFAHQLTFE